MKLMNVIIIFSILVIADVAITLHVAHAGTTSRHELLLN